MVVGLLAFQLIGRGHLERAKRDILESDFCGRSVQKKLISKDYITSLHVFHTWLSLELFVSSEELELHPSRNAVSDAINV